MAYGELVRIETKAVTRALIFSGSRMATRRLMTPSSSSFWMRRQQGVVDSPTFFATSATARRCVFLQQAQDLAVKAVHKRAPAGKFGYFPSIQST